MHPSRRRRAAWRFWVRVVLAVAGVSCLFVVSHGDRFRSAWLWQLVGDKVPHAAAYAMLAALLLLVGVRGLRGIALLSVIGALDEFTQPWFGRSCTLGDWLTDLAAILAVYSIHALLRHLARRRPAPTAQRLDP